MKRSLLELLEPVRQAHLLDHWSGLDEAARRSLDAQIRQIDFSLIDRLYREQGESEDWHTLAMRATGPPAIRLADPMNQERTAEACRAGEQLIRAGRVAVILVAGGQGTRLGFANPKGMYPIGPISEASLFQILFEKILAVSRRFGATIPLYLMTSPATDAATRAYLESNDRFGLPSEDLWIFCQGTMPSIDAKTGKVLLAAPDRVSVSPNGHGGMVAALADRGALADLKRRGITHVYYMQVDNPLVDVCDPALLGHHLAAESELSTQVVAKRDPLDRVGNVVSVDTKVRIIEYSDLPEEAARRHSADGSLVLWAGNTAVHVFDVALLADVAQRSDALPYHRALKRIPYVDSDGRLCEPPEPSAIKFERFIFDLLPLARHAIVVEVDEATRFAPLKNEPGAADCSPEWVHRRMAAVHRGWLSAAGVDVADDVLVEISPLWAHDQQALAARGDLPRRVTEPRYFC